MAQVDKTEWGTLASGVIDMLVLRLLTDGPSYGYAITGDLSHHGLTDANEATVYAALKRLERAKLLSSARELAPNGRARRYYSITRAGHRSLEARLASWDDLSKVVASIFASGIPEAR